MNAELPDEKFDIGRMTRSEQEGAQVDRTELLYNTLEYSIRNSRHLIDTVWVMHSAVTGHLRGQFPMPTCTVCIGLTNIAKQNDELLAQVIRKDF